MKFISSFPRRDQKCVRSQKYAAENGLPVLKNVLLPKAKGFFACLETLRGTLDAGSNIFLFSEPYFTPGLCLSILQAPKGVSNYSFSTLMMLYTVLLIWIMQIAIKFLKEFRAIEHLTTKY